ncbi:16S rRNA (guanine(966)-N(2))-methyltransferase RsmD [Alteromonas sp. C1M14]|uniref:16S rRNA (guanine(966)-N(2))-methyltransferase RsmD n=1 Tax=Alteromonas sp. C1M14 TaxID=2841567 RepID=UPI001C09384A|nr:16S rRNA (guanine(966)-N(2))-methyltransferase RsmD [Alteromonas sp. C1M14]MBU2977312.1 16S rRNA (guanine(966)-N(2))-methyltransferase RsmD [Alteromonas sp. C1M14]
MKRVSKKPLRQKQKPGNVRIIAGQWRGRKLPVADTDGLRPTTDRNKETLFNWLMADLHDAQCLDVFAGSGGLGFEALSRYAGHCTFVEYDRAVAEQLSKNVSVLHANAKVIQSDALKALPTLGQRFDIIFIDPPFNKNLAPPALQLILQHGLVNPDGVIYVEQEINAAPLPTDPRLVQIKEKRLAQVQYQLLRYQASTDEG